MADNPAFQDENESNNIKKRNLGDVKLDPSNIRQSKIDMSDSGHAQEKTEDNGAIDRVLTRISSGISSWHKAHRKAIRYVLLAVLNIAVLGYFFGALDFWYKHDVLHEWHFCTGFGMLLILYSILYFFLLYFIIVKPFFGKAISKAVLKPMGKFVNSLWRYWFVKVIVGVIILGAFLTFIIIDTEDSRERLVSLGGYIILLFLGFILSKHPGKVNFRPVLWGVVLHVVMGFLTIRWEVGRLIFQCLGDKVNTFLGYAGEGSQFVFGDFLVNEKKVFAFAVLPVIFFFSVIIEILFYWGAMQWICLKMGWLLQITMGTTVCESVIVAANIFLGMSESPLLIKPYIADLTKSELHTIFTSGFATVSGTVLAAYISFGVSPAHLITASVMAAPAALCFSKLSLPETTKSKTDVKNLQTVTTPHPSVLAAATSGASNAIPLVLNIAANLVAFVSVVAFLNGILSWLGYLVGWDFLTFEWLIGKIFLPLSFILGVPWEECERVGELIGLKTVVNEFVAYEKMGQFLKEGLLSPRAEAIATYALCGFTNPSSVGIMVGALSAMAPSKKDDITNVAIRALLTGCGVCFLSASLAGLLISPGDYNSGVTTIGPDYK